MFLGSRISAAAYILVIYFTPNEALEGDPDFASVLNSSSFVDSSMLIRDWLAEKPTRILIMAPPKSGKSTNLHMLRRFLEMEVDEEGAKVERNDSVNYQFFKDNNLNVIKRQDLFNEHFGKYPVIFIDCKPLQKSYSFKEFLNKFRNIVMSIFTHHKYLLNFKNLWLDEIEVNHFKNFISQSDKARLNAADLTKALSYLSEILNTHFKKRVVLLVDDYDAVADSLDSTMNMDIDRIIQFLKKLYNALLRNNKFVDRVLLTGKDLGSGSTVPVLKHSVLPGTTVAYSHQDKRPMCRFFRHTFS